MKNRFKKTLCTLLVILLITGVSPVGMLAKMDWPTQPDVMSCAWLYNAITGLQKAAGWLSERLQGLFIMADAEDGGSIVTGECGTSLTWSLDLNTGTITISGTGYMQSYGNLNDIPWRTYMYKIHKIVLEQGVTSVGYQAFAGTSVAEVQFSDSVIDIESLAFFRCTYLHNLILPPSIQYIGSQAFARSGLNWIVLNDHYFNIAISIGQKAFYETPYYRNSSNWLDDVLYLDRYLIEAKAVEGQYEVQSGTIGIADYAFNQNAALTGIRLPDSIMRIGHCSFCDCTSLSSIRCPESVKYIGSYAFSGCSNLTSFFFPNQLKTINSNMLSGCKSLESVALPDSTNEIASQAFYNCSSLNEIIIPASVTKIGFRAFGDCASLKRITVDELNQCFSTDKRGMLFNADKTELVCCPAGTEEQFFVLPDDVTQIREGAFSGCQSINGLLLTNAVVNIGSSAFINCPNLTVFAYPNSYAEQYCIEKVVNYQNHFTVSLDTLGGSGLDNELASNGIGVDLCNPVFPELPLVQKENATFLGWYASEYGSDRIVPGQPFLWNQTVYARWASSFEVSKTPCNLEFFVGEAVDTTGLELRAVCETGEIMRITDGYSYSPEALEKAGTQTVTVTYVDASTSYLVNVYEPEQDGLSVHTMPNKTEYFEGETLDLSGLELAVHQNNNTETIITEGYDCVTATLLETPGEHRVVLAYNGMYTSFDVHVEAVVATNAEIVSPANITTFYTGDTLSTKGLALCVSYNNGTTQTVSTGFICSPQTLNQAGTQTIVVTYEGLTVYYDVSVIQKQLATLEVIQSPKQTVYYVGDTLNTKGLKMQRVYNNYDVKPITDLSAVSFAYDFSSSGQKTVTASYTENGKTVQTTFSVTVLQKPEIFVESVSAAAGDEFAVPICIRGNNGLAGFKVSVQYDASVLVPLHVDAGSILGMNVEGNTNTFSDNAAENPSGKVDVIWAGARNMTENGMLFTVYFATDPSIGGNYPITVSYSEGDTFDAEFNLVKMVCTDATVTLDNSGYVPSPVIKAESINVQMSEQIRVPIHLKHSDGINSVMVLNVNYPADVFSFAALENGTASVLSATATANGVQIVLMNAPAATDSVLFTLVLNVSEKAGGRYTFEPVDPTGNIQTESGTVFIQTLSTTLFAEDQRIQQGTTTITVPVNIANNRGIMGLSAIISYDPNCLRLTEITRGEALTSGSLQKNLATEGQAILVYTDSSDTTVNGTVFVLEFQALAGLINQTEITLSYSQEDTFNEAWEDVVLECSGATIYKVCPGDADEDGEITLQDVVLITRWLAGGWNVTINDLNSDVNRDGVINLKDAVLIRRYLAGGWGVVLR